MSEEFAIEAQFFIQNVHWEGAAFPSELAFFMIFLFFLFLFLANVKVDQSSFHKVIFYADKKVLRFDVPVSNLLLVKVGNCVRSEEKNLHDSIILKRPVLLNILVQINKSRQVFHNEIRLSVILICEKRIDLRYVWMIQIFQQQVFISSKWARVFPFAYLYSIFFSIYHVFCHIHAGIGTLK